MKTPNLFKRTLCLVLGAMTICSMATTSVLAADVDINGTYTEITPKYIELSHVQADISIKDGVATCRSDTGASHNNYSTKIEMYLQQKQTSWKNLKSWSETGGTFSSLKKSYAVKSGYDYRVYAVATVYDASGKVIERGSAYSSIEHA